MSCRQNSHRHATSRSDAVHEARVHPPGYGWMELSVIDDADDDVSVELVLSIAMKLCDVNGPAELA